VVRTYYHSADESAPPLRDLSGKDPLAAPTLNRVLLDRSPLGEATVGRDKYVHTLANHLHGQELVGFSEPHTYHAGGGPAHRTKGLVIALEPDGLGPLADQQQVVRGPHQRRSHEFIVVTQVNGDDPAAPVGVELGK